jgi:hypothetical protein
MALRHAAREGLEVLGRERVEERDLGEELGVQHRAGAERAPRWSRARHLPRKA